MSFYGCFITLMWIHAAIATANRTPRNMEVPGKDEPGRDRAAERRSSLPPVVTCISPSTGKPPPMELFQELSSKFYLYIEGVDLIDKNTTLERSYLRNRIWYTFSFKIRSICPFPLMKASNGPVIQPENCKEEFDTIWSGYKVLLFYVSFSNLEIR
jgi:hypothetical protein